MATTVRNVLLEAVGRTENAQRAVRNLGDEVRDLPNARTVTVRTEVNRALAELKSLRKELRSVDRESATPEVNVAITKALLDIDAFEAKLRAIPENKRVDIEVRRGILTDLASIERGTNNIVRSLDRASRPARTFGDVLGDAVQTVKSITPVVNGLAIIFAVKLVAGLLAVGASAVSAAGGIVVLGNAMLALLGPAVVLAIGVFNRLAKVLEALKLQDQARDAAARRTAQGSQAARQAADQRRAAENALRDAIQGVTTAERQLREAQRQAGEQIEQAEQRAERAQEALAEATRVLEQEWVAAHRAMEDAVERVADAVLALESAELGEDEAALGTREAVEALRAYREELGLTSAALDNVFRKFTDVDFEFDSKALQKVLAGAGVENTDEQLELERRILAVRRAKLGEKEATDRLQDSERDLADARRENARFQQQGIRAYQPYIDAINTQNRAQEEANQAAAEARRLEELGIRNAPAVIAAREALRDAEERLAEARRQKRNAATAGLADDQLRAKQATDELTASERRFLGVLKQVRTELEGFLRPAVDAVFGAMSRALLNAPRLLNPLRGAFNELGQAWASVIDAFSAELVRPEWVNALRYFVQQSAILARILGGDAFIAFSRIMRNLAIITVPLLVDLSRDLARWLGSVARSTGNVGKTAPVINAMVQSFRAWLRLAGAVVNVLLALVGTSSEAGDSLLGWLTDAINGFARWLRTAEGQEQVREFFEDTIPAVRSMLKTLALMARIFFRLLQFVAPVLDGMASGFNTVLGLIDGLLGLLNDIVSNPWGRAIRFAIGQFLSVGAILRGLRLLVGLLGRIGGSLFTIGGRVISHLARPFIQAGETIISLFSRLPGRIGLLVSRAPAAISNALRGGGGLLRTAGEWVIRQIVGGGRGLLQLVFTLGRQVFNRIATGVRSLAENALALGRTVIRWIVNGARGIFTSVFNAGRDVVNRLIAGARSLANRMVDLGKSLLEGLVLGFTTVGGAVFDAIKGLGDKIVDAVKDVLGIASPSKVMQQLGEFMLAGLIKGFTSGDVVGFIKKHLGGIAGLAKDLALAGADSLLPLPLRGVKELGGLALDALPGLAKGGIVNRETIARIGERGREAVLPLSRRVMRQLAGALAGELGSFAMPTAFAGGAPTPAVGYGPGTPSSRTVIEQLDMHVNTPGNSALDPVAASANFARQIKRMGR